MELNKALWGMIFLMVMVLLPSISAFEFDNVISERTDIKIGDSYTIGDKVIPYNELWKTYKPIEIKNTFGLGETLYKDVLTKHSDSCGAEVLCEDIWEKLNKYIKENSLTK